LMPTEGMGERKATQRRKDRVMQILHTLPEKAQTAILESLTEEDMQRYGISKDQDRTELIEITRENPPEDADPFGYQAMQESQSESMVEGSPAGEGEGEGDKAGSGDPNADAEARRAPPDPPESDEPLVGVPVDEYAGGTVVLPQAGEHTKSEDEKSGADGSDQDSSSEGQDESADQDTDDQDTQVHQQQSGQDQDDDQDTQQIPVGDQGGSSEQSQGERSSRGDERGGWASDGSGSNGSDGGNAPGANGADANGADTNGSAGQGSDGASSSSGSQREEGGLRRLFRRSGS
jgi:hypothetical protein